VALFGTGLVKIVLVIGFLSWPGAARVIRAQVMVIRREEFVLSAIMSGARTPRVLWRHILSSVSPWETPPVRAGVCCCNRLSCTCGLHGG
jgi:ABC-type dipeptide/oligopeptide/nickel transport system permease subunit